MARPLVNQAVFLVQDSSLSYAVSLRDFRPAAGIVAGRDDR
jgi:hypothetical protein